MNGETPQKRSERLAPYMGSRRARFSDSRIECPPRRQAFADSRRSSSGSAGAWDLEFVQNLDERNPRRRPRPLAAKREAGRRLREALKKSRENDPATAIRKRVG